MRTSDFLAVHHISQQLYFTVLEHVVLTDRMKSDIGSKAASGL